MASFLLSTIQREESEDNRIVYSSGRRDRVQLESSLSTDLRGPEHALPSHFLPFHHGHPLGVLLNTSQKDSMKEFPRLGSLEESPSPVDSEATDSEDGCVVEILPNGLTYHDYNESDDQETPDPRHSQIDHRSASHEDSENDVDQSCSEDPNPTPLQISQESPQKHDDELMPPNVISSSPPSLRSPASINSAAIPSEPRIESNPISCTDYSSTPTSKEAFSPGSGGTSTPQRKRQRENATLPLLNQRSRSSTSSRSLVDDEPVDMLIDDNELPGPSQRRKRRAPQREYMEDNYSSEEEKEAARDAIPPRHNKRSKATDKPKPFACPHPGCKKSFTRRNDVTRHLSTASVHKAQEGGEPSQTRCSKCGEELSRLDALRRHELKQACGKRKKRNKDRSS